MNTKIQPVRPAGISDEAAERLAFYHRFMQRPDAREILEEEKAELRKRGLI